MFNFRLITCFFLLLGQTISVWSETASERDYKIALTKKGQSLVYYTTTSSVPNMPVMDFVARYPKGVKPGEKVEGIFIYLAFFQEMKNVQHLMINENSPFFDFADKHKLAVLSCTTRTVYSLQESFNLTKQQMHDPDNPMEKAFRVWRMTMDKYCKDWGLPTDGYFIYGYSRGAQWAHRIVLRDPKRFAAVQIHVSCSYETPWPEAKRCLWLVTSGELDSGKQSSKEFYRRASEAGYPIMLRIFPNLGHSVSPEQLKLSQAFFDYAVQLNKCREERLAENERDLMTQGKIKREDVFFDELLVNFKEPPYYGDMENGNVVTEENRHVIPAAHRVGIPCQEIAESWGYFNN